MKDLNSSRCFRALKTIVAICSLGVVMTASAAEVDVTKAVGYEESDWRVKSHQAFLKDHAKRISTTLLFLGDSITQGWTSTWIKHHGMETWKTTLKGYAKVNLGLSSDRVEHVLWRVTEGKEIDHFTAKVIILMIGTNNGGETPEIVAARIEHLLKVLREKRPEAKILLLGVLPVAWRMQKSVQINELICKFADNETIFYRDYSKLFLTEDGKKTVNLHDGIHPDAKGYEEWGKALVADLPEIMNGKKAEAAAE